LPDARRRTIVPICISFVQLLALELSRPDLPRLG
jgi:hypothetical protein